MQWESIDSTIECEKCFLTNEGERRRRRWEVGGGEEEERQTGTPVVLCHPYGDVEFHLSTHIQDAV